MCLRFVPETKGKTLEELGEAMDRDDSSLATEMGVHSKKQVRGSERA